MLDRCDGAEAHARLRRAGARLCRALQSVRPVPGKRALQCCRVNGNQGCCKVP